MIEAKQIYKCDPCGEIVEVLRGGPGELVCCGQPMRLMRANTVDASQEKHVPVITPIEGGYRVVVGQEKHPMTAEHHIEWIELIADGIIYRQELEPGAEPEAVFMAPGGNVEARTSCNLHGLWSKEI